VKRYLLDTNIISELHKPKPHGGVAAWFDGLRDEQIYLSSFTFAELQEGIERTRKQDPEKARSIELWVDRLEGSFSILPMDARCFREVVRMMLGKQEHLYDDAMIAATAHLHGLTVATRNEKDFANFTVEYVNPFKII
jgi:predicted nucleic acid-binding protein